MHTDVRLADRVQRIAAFSVGNQGGNPAGVVIYDVFPDDVVMQRIAAQVGYSETAFAVESGNGWRVRYFSPESEVPFCGHATIALGAALAREKGDGIFALTTNNADITVEAQQAGDLIRAALQSPATRSSGMETDLQAEVLALFGYSANDLDMRIPPARANAGADHLILALKTREQLSAMEYDLAAGREFMKRFGVTTVAWMHAETSTRFHSRNAFASGGIYEDPATGAAAAALAGYLRDIGWAHNGGIDILQGQDMGRPSHLRAEFSFVPGSSVRVSGTARMITEK
ncbi:PhzF family phenazine biosynthesis protein [Candidimonas sp. SYP-B2681]|uniref:PhzF family phenazine biosynthesis protein n=1 Tax=Candidimonas sp. SYP-B2681 TaxID=2497686 RepID=UPI000F893365|nr:PhzF family phenazine biosynthesis protein [Candidimonas sp. SYP-B2681]RTZ47851.1 PhzF family phenazine biosynthesis protein [Candidimonas sp. SYP-B2681]